jgi:hypothetical protein
MRLKDIRMLVKDEDKIPEGCFLTEILDELEKANRPGKPIAEMSTKELRQHADAIDQREESNQTVKITSIDWYGEGSGHTFDYLKSTVAPLIKGRIEAVFVWEGGDLITGLIIEDGKVTECDVAYKLTPKKSESGA